MCASALAARTCVRTGSLPCWLINRRLRMQDGIAILTFHFCSKSVVELELELELLHIAAPHSGRSVFRCDSLCQHRLQLTVGL